jgi:DNA replication protein DnaC
VEPIGKIIGQIIKPIGKRTCETCGSEVPIYERQGKKVSVCLECENQQMKKEHTEFVQRADQRKEERLFEQFSIIPDDLQDATFESYNARDNTQLKALEKSIDYSARFKEIREGAYTDKKGLPTNSLIFMGDYGLGKSHLSYSIYQSLKKQGYHVLFIDVPSLLDMVRSTFKNSDVSKSDILNMCARADLLVLDDLGAEYIKMKDGEESWAADVIFQIVTSRTGKPLIVTTNYTMDGLARKYGEHGGRIVSRLQKDARPVLLMGDDYRKQGW